MTATARCGVILHPAGHTLSPVLHETAYRELELDASFEVFDVEPDALASTLCELGSAGVRQLAVSLPHKEAVIRLADRVAPAAHRIGAANTLTRTAHGFEAANTDWIGVVRTLEPLGPWSGRRALVLGAGGAARAVVHALRELGLHVGVANRTRERAEGLVRELGGEVVGLDAPHDLLVNATSVGMSSDATPLPRTLLRPGTTVFDLVYRPLETRLLREARAAGCRAQDGLDMLVYQAVEQVEIWSGRRPDSRALRRAAERAL